MTLFDYVVLTIVAASVIVSVMRGFAREVLALAGWVLAFIAANALSAMVAEWFAPISSDGSLRALMAFVAVFILTLIAASLLAMGVSRLLKGAGLGLEDRLLGGFFGLARGVLIVMLIVLLAGAVPAWPHARNWGYAPSGLLGLLLLIPLAIRDEPSEG